ncbi:WecB/TagA/CpsF family glycosyltransferase [Vacuolonema iberomarrocanum]|uniref:WecB/TagA/CpsF family glycosyltransferase n=1 Tax=Vacuolonema iberomarrocanum TaxID=3454632 RepID=UPI0019FF5F92|nr:WecB/TagA/CpsF family glycosyltransferase [filamentous cyanobacterium LEGE 07170]
MSQVRILNLEIDNYSMQEFLEELESGVVFTPNVDHLMKLQHDVQFMEAYQAVEYKVCDSKVLIYASRLLGKPLKEKLSGSDLFPAFYTFHKHNPDIRIFLLGAAAGVAETAQQNINTKVGRDIIVGTYSPPYGFETDQKECDRIIEMVQDSGANVLAVGLGAPKQEMFIYKYRHAFPTIKIFLAIGATIDFEAENVNRAPKWMSNVGLEWLYRLASEPSRLWRRYVLEDSGFFLLFMSQLLGLYSDPLKKKHRSRLNKKQQV